MEEVTAYLWGPCDPDELSFQRCGEFFGSVGGRGSGETQSQNFGLQGDYDISVMACGDVF